MWRRLAPAAGALALTASIAHAQPAPQHAPARPMPVVQPAQTPPPVPPPAPVPSPAQSARTPKPPTPPPAPPPPREGQPVNIKVDVVITDQRSSATPVKKTVSVIVGDLNGGMIRSESNLPGVGIVPLHVDAQPEILKDGKIRLRFGLNYDLASPEGAGAPAQKTSIRENLTLILENGKPLLATQSADPMGDRQVTVEVKATILK